MRLGCCPVLFVPQVADITLHPEAFVVENGLLTPSFKLKRPQAKERFAREIADMYARLQK